MKWIIAVSLVISAICTIGCLDLTDNPEKSDDDEEGIRISVDHGEWIKLQGTVQKISDQEYTLSTYSGSDGFTIISWKGSKPEGKFEWSFINDGPAEGNIFQSRLSHNIDYFSFFIEEKEALDSPGHITITSFGDTGEFVTGNFIIEKASKVDDASGMKLGSVKIEGTFRVKRSI